MQKGYMRPFHTYIQTPLRENESGSVIYEIYLYYKTKIITWYIQKNYPAQNRVI